MDNSYLVINLCTLRESETLNDLIRPSFPDHVFNQQPACIINITAAISCDQTIPENLCA